MYVDDRKGIEISHLFSLEMDEIFTKEDLKLPKPYHIAKSENMKHFVSPTSNLAPKMVVPRASPGRIIVVLF